MATYGEGGYGEGEYGGEGAEATTSGLRAEDDGEVWRTSEYDDPATELIDWLPVYYNRNLTSDNYTLFDPVGDWIRRLDNDMALIEQEAYVQTAQRYASLELIGELVNVYPTENEHIEHFRARVIAGFHEATSDGTTRDLISGVAAMLGVEPTAIAYDEQDPRTIVLTVPEEVLEGSVLTAQEAADIAEDFVGPVKDVIIEKTGTFRFISYVSHTVESDEVLNVNYVDVEYIDNDDVVSIGPTDTYTIGLHDSETIGTDEVMSIGPNEVEEIGDYAKPMPLELNVDGELNMGEDYRFGFQSYKQDDIRGGTFSTIVGEN